MIENPLHEAEQGIFQEQSQGNPTPSCTILRVPFKKWIKKKKKRKEMDGGNALNAQMVHYCGPGFNPWFGN